MIVIKNDLTHDVAEFLNSCAADAVKDHGAFILGVSGGSMASFLGSLGDFADFSQWHIFLVDERAVSLSHDESNFRAIQASWPASKNATWHPINEAFLGDLKGLAEDYECQIAKAFSDFNVDKFDCLLLGLGPDGHTASLFPNHPDFLKSLDSEKTVIPVTNSPKPPSLRISLSPRAIQQAVNSAFVITNSGNKASVVAAIVRGKDTAFPPTLVAPNAHWFLDETSGSQLINK